MKNRLGIDEELEKTSKNNNKKWRAPERGLREKYKIKSIPLTLVNCKKTSNDNTFSHPLLALIFTSPVVAFYKSFKFSYDFWLEFCKLTVFFPGAVEV